MFADAERAVGRERESEMNQAGRLKSNRQQKSHGAARQTDRERERESGRASKAKAGKEERVPGGLPLQ